MKTAVIADIHNNFTAFSAVVKDIILRGNINRIIFAGDLLDYGSSPIECLVLLMSLKGNYELIGVLGNHDTNHKLNNYLSLNTEHGRQSHIITHKLIDRGNTKICDKFYDYFNNSDFMITDDGIVITHGNIYGQRCKLYKGDTKYYESIVNNSASKDIKVHISAHTHLQFLDEYKGVKFLNPGSVGQSRNTVPKAHYAIIDENYDVELIQLDYDIDKEVRGIVDTGADTFLGTRLYLGI